VTKSVAEELRRRLVEYDEVPASPQDFVKSQAALASPWEGHIRT
jgi:hypothetical protein